MKFKKLEIFIAVMLILFGILFFAQYEFNMHRTARVLFIGDMMFDRTIRKIGDVKGYDYLFSCVSDYLKSYDLVVGNLEGPITNEISRSLSTKPGEEGNTTFTFDPEAASALSRNNIMMVNLGNNHIFDFGKSGARSTGAALQRNGIRYFGIPGESLAATTSLGDIRVALVNFNQFLGENDPSKTKAEIKKAKKENDFVAVYTHWGDEYVSATEYEKTLARGFIDAGADMVVGTHPHVIQDHEIYHGKHIFYSLGNFIFDQYWSKDVRTGGGVSAMIGKKEILAQDVAFDISKDGKTCLQTSK